MAAPRHRGPSGILLFIIIILLLLSNNINRFCITVYPHRSDGRVSVLTGLLLFNYFSFNILLYIYRFPPYNVTLRSEPVIVLYLKALVTYTVERTGFPSLPKAGSTFAHRPSLTRPLQPQEDGMKPPKGLRKERSPRGARVPRKKVLHRGGNKPFLVSTTTCSHHHLDCPSC